MQLAPKKLPATIVAGFIAVLLVASPILFRVDVIELEIKFLQALETRHLDNILVGIILIFIGFAIDRALELRRSAEALRRSQQSLEHAAVQFVDTMAQALDARDKYTAGHSERVSNNSTKIAQALRLSAREVETIRIGGRLHDIGKIGVPDTVLQKPGTLSDEEYALIRLHPQIGKRILEKVDRFNDYLPIVELHHENFDGSGYPHGLSGDRMPVSAQIVHVADVFDAITSDRAYRKAMSPAEVLAIMSDGSGKQFDPVVLAAFLDLLGQGKLVDATAESEANRSTTSKSSDDAFKASGSR